MTKRQFQIAIRKDDKGQDIEYAIADPRVVHEDGSVSMHGYFRGGWDEIITAEEVEEKS